MKLLFEFESKLELFKNLDILQSTFIFEIYENYCGTISIRKSGKNHEVKGPYVSASDFLFEIGYFGIDVSSIPKDLMDRICVEGAGHYI